MVGASESSTANANGGCIIRPCNAHSFQRTYVQLIMLNIISVCLVMVNLFSLAPGGGQKVSAQVGSVNEELDFGNIASERHATKREYSTLESLAVFALARTDLV